MFNLLSDKMKIFNWEFDWPLESALFWLLIVQVALIMFMVLVFAILIKRVGTNKIVVDTKPSERILTGLTLDLSMVKRTFDVGEQFNCDGLVVTANYNLDPMSEPISKVAVFTPETLEMLQEKGPLDVCYALYPDTSVEGKVSVTVCYQGQQALYVISVGEHEEAPAPVVAPVVVETPVQETDSVRTLVGLDLNLEVVQRDFVVGDEFNCDGLMVTANYSEEPLAETIIEFSLLSAEEYAALSEKDTDDCYVILPDLSQEGKPAVTVCYKDKSAMYMIVVSSKEEDVQPQEEPAERKLVGVTLDLAAVRCQFTEGDEFDCNGLVINAQYDLDPTSETVAEFAVVDQQLYDHITAENELVGCYVIKPDMSVAGDKEVAVKFDGQTAYYTISVSELTEEERKQREPIIIEEESVEAGRLRYDRSFTARLIQSEDDVKFWYNDIKNEILNYKKSKCRMSWKRETFKVGKIVVAKLSFRGKTLCLFLPLDVTEFVDSKYQLEDVSDTPSNFDTPAMYRIKSAKRAKYAVELVAMAMERMGIERIEREAEDYYMPYEGIVELIKKGLAKRDIKFAADEAIFDQGKAKTEEDNSAPIEIAPGLFVTSKTVEETEKEVAATEVPEVPERVIRELVSLSLNTDNVQKEFFVGDALNHDGLVVTASYNAEPFTEEVQDYTVLPPDMDKEGSPTVSVVYQDRTVGYRINVVALPEEERKQREPIIIEEESVEAGRLRYDRSFTARLIQSEDDVKFWYNDIKNEILNYKKSKCRMSWKRETFKVGKIVVAKLSFRGKTLCLFLPLDVTEFVDSKYQLEDVSDTPSNFDTPAMYRIKSAKRAKYAVELVAMAMERMGIERIEREAEDYYMPYEGIVELIKKGLAKRDIKFAADEAIFDQGKAKTEEDNSAPIEIAPGLFVTSKTVEETEKDELDDDNKQ